MCIVHYTFDMTTQDAIKHAGGVIALASLLGITRSAVYQWGKYPPPGAQLLLERVTRKKLKAEPGCLAKLIGQEQAA